MEDTPVEANVLCLGIYMACGLEEKVIGKQKEEGRGKNRALRNLSLNRDRACDLFTGE